MRTDDDVAGRGQSPTTLERVAWLFEVVTAPPGPGGTAAEGTWRPYTNHEVGQALGVALGLGPGVGVTVVEEIRAGRSNDRRALEALARFFGTDPTYFGEELGALRKAQDRLLVRALRDSDVTRVALCRSPALAAGRRRARLRQLLDLARAHRSAVEVSAGAGGSSDTVRTGSSHGSRWQQPGVAHMTPLSGPEIRQLCVSLLQELDIVPPLTPELLCQRLGEQRRRRIKLLAEEAYTTSSVGHLICKPRHDVIVYQRTAPRLQQAHVIYHEVIHLIRGHLDGGESLTCGALDGAGKTGEFGLYSHWQEWEAETGATVLTELAHAAHDPRVLRRHNLGLERGLAATFGMRPGGWLR